MKEYKIVILGGGPGGYAAAVEAGMRGLKTALIEKDYVGGTCVNWGCIITKALLKYAKSRKKGSHIDYPEAARRCVQISVERRETILSELKRLGVDVYAASGQLVSASEVELAPSGERIRGENIIVATGSSARKLSIADYDDSHIVTSREALFFQEAPKSIVVVGSGATGIELASVWTRFGSQVTVLEMLPTIMGSDDLEQSELAKAHFRSEGMTLETGVTVEGMARIDSGVAVIYRDAAGVHTIEAEKAMVAAGIVPNSDGIGLEAAGVETDRGYVKIDIAMRTNIPHIYAIGDITGKPALAFTASKQGKLAVAHIAGEDAAELDYDLIPRCVFSSMEAAYMGLNETQARQAGYDVKVYRDRLISHDGNLIGHEKGQLKLVSDAASGKVLGVSIFGSEIADRISVPARLIPEGSDAQTIIDSICSGR